MRKECGGERKKKDIEGRHRTHAKRGVFVCGKGGVPNYLKRMYLARRIKSAEKRPMTAEKKVTKKGHSSKESNSNNKKKKHIAKIGPRRILSVSEQ